MTTFVQTERWSFAGVDLNTYAAMVASLESGDTLPNLRGDNLVVPSRPGRYLVRKEFDQRRLALALWVSHLDTAGLDGVTPSRQARANLDAILTTLGRRTTADLVRVMPDGSTRTATAECVSVDVPEYPAEREGFPVVADFLLADPWFYGDTVVAGPTSLAASPATQSLVHPGTVAGGRIVFDFTGPASNPRVTNVTNGWYLECLVTVAAGKHLVLDPWAATALNDGVQAIASVRHSGGALLFRVEPGTNSLSITTGTVGGSLTSTFQPPYA